MTDLPDLDTDNVSYVAYVNLLNIQDNEDSIDPEDSLSLGSITDYDLYDNGFDARVERGSSTTASYEPLRLRAKSDGWYVAYIPDNANLQYDKLGQHQVLDSLGTESTPTLTKNKLERTIYQAAQELSNWDPGIKSEYTADKVGLYNYRNENATGSTLLTRLTTDLSKETWSGSFSTSNDTTLHEGIIEGFADDPYSGSGFTMDIDVGGTDFLNFYSGSSPHREGRVEYFQDLLVFNAGDSYGAYVRADGDNTWSKLNLLFLWS